MQEKQSSIPSGATGEDYTKAELNEFRDLVEGGESRDQVRRIGARLDMLKFVERVGREKCNVMFEVLNKELEDEN